MNILDIIAKKRDNIALSKEEIEYFVTEYTKDNIADYQAAALIMAIYINGMNDEEITDLTLAMANSGDVLDLSILNDTIVDKHSTGGIGDKITLVLTPLMASMGVKVAKMSGRGLGITGGTIDKLESIPEFNTSLNIDEFINNINECGISLIGQTLTLAPADKKLYALRDVTSTVGNIPLIASSVMSKKIAAGADKIVLDVTIGKGAFMKNEEDGTKLAKLMNKIGELSGRETISILTNMNEPLGKAVGNSLEIIESVKFLKGEMSEDILEIVLTIGSYIIKLAGKGENLQQNKNNILENIYNKKGYSKFLELVKKQGGDISYIENTEKFEKAKYILELKSDCNGYIKEINAEKIGNLSVFLGAGRITKSDQIDYAVGIIFDKKTGDKVQFGETLAYIHLNLEEKISQSIQMLKESYTFSDNMVKKEKNILKVIG